MSTQLASPAPAAVHASAEPSAPVIEQKRKQARLTALARQPRLLLLIIVAVSATVMIGALRRTSTTFDEIIPLTAGARGYATGDWGMAHDLPPVTQYLYGLPVHLSQPTLPPELQQDTTPHRYVYARTLLWSLNNDGERLILLARLLAVACALTLVLLSYRFAAGAGGRGAGLLAAGLVAFLPDVLAHGGIAYNDIVMAPAFLAALMAIDAAVRTPSIRRGLLAGVLASLALGIKHSALALAPIAVLLLIMEATRADRRRWAPRVLLATATALVAAYLVQVLLYRGDFALTDLVAGTTGLRDHLSLGHGVPSYLLGQARAHAYLYFYPVAFLFKTPVALHLLMLIALVGAVRSVRGRSLSELMRSPARTFVIGVLVFGAFLLRANLTIGFRYALPVLPLLCILTALGVAVVWSQSGRAVRAAVIALALWSAGSALAQYPHFIAYTSEHQPDKGRAYDVFVDSNLDWGQGLKELREFMREERIPQIYLSYFGSALPDGYGIDYIPLPSFFPLPYRPNPAVDQPKFAAVSATNLVGLYLPGDPFGGLRNREPYRVLGNSILVYKLDP